MRGIRTKFGTALIFVAAMCLSAQHAAAQLVSHNFDGGTTQGWGPRGPVTVAVSGDVARSAPFSLKTTGRTASWNGPALNVLGTLQPNTTYQITGWVRLVAGQSPDSLKFTVQRDPGPTFEQVNAPVMVTDAAWVQLQGTFTFSGTDTTGLTLYLEAAGATTSYYLDDFSIVALSEPPPTCSEPLDQSGFTSDFEDATNQDWSPRGAVTLTNTTEDAHAGARSLKVTNRTATWQGPARNVLCKFHSGSKYRVSVWTKLVPGGTASTQLRVSFERRLGTTTSFHTVIPNTTVTSSGWTNLAVDYNFGLAYDALTLYVESNSDPTVSFYIDDVEVRHLPAKPIQTNIPSVHEVLADYFPIGAAIEPFQTVGLHGQLALKHFNSIVAENSMKVGPIHPTESTYNFTNADTLADFARANGLEMRGHTLLWHSQNPNWLFQDASGNPLQPGPTTRALLLQRLRDHILTVMARYGDVIKSWDVVNEVIDPGQPDGLRRTPWYNLVGPDYIDFAFDYAYEADPNALLCINDFSTTDTAKRAALLNVVQGMLNRGVPVNCVGHQMHINVVNPSLDAIRTTLVTFGDLGLTNQITEMDVSAYTNSTSTAPVSEETLVLQGYRYRDIFKLYRELQPIISHVTLWGLADDTTWLKGFPIARPDKPLLFDEELQAKHAYWGVVDPLQLPVIIQQVDVSGGAVRVKGDPDAAWNTVPAVQVPSDGSLKATFKAMWEPSTLYVLVDVQDSTQDAGDTVEVFVDQNNNRTPSLGSDDLHFTINPYSAPPKNLQVHTTLTARGYRTVLAVALQTPATAGRRIGFDVIVTDGAGSGQTIVWNDFTLSHDTTLQDVGVLRLVSPVKVASAAMGTPVIDAQEDHVWKKAQDITTVTFVLGTSGATARVKTLWDANKLYIYATVTDNLLSKASNNPWEEDSVEIFIDQNNAKTTSYQSDDEQYRVNFDNEQSFGGAASAGQIVSATRTTSTGYIVEAAITFDAIHPTPGTLIGFDVQVNNDGAGNGIRTSVATWSDNQGTAFQDPSRFGVLKLLDGNAK
jgi:endo-1,4-beta-xylanase